MIERYKVADKAIMVGKKPYNELPKYLAADICLLPAYKNKIMRDIIPIKTYEYMPIGNPVISTKLPGIVKEFGNNNGVIFINESKETLEKAIELIQNKRNF